MSKKPLPKKPQLASLRTRIRALEHAVTAAIVDGDRPFAPGDLAFDDEGYPVTVLVGALVTISDASGRPRAVPAYTLTRRAS